VRGNRAPSPYQASPVLPLHLPQPTDPGLRALAHGDKVIDVALSLGYASPSAFTAMFKKRFGQLPSQFFH